MQPLSDILPAMMSPEDLQKGQQLGLTTTDGTMIPIIKNRERALTESELTVIASKLLLRAPVVSLTKKNVYATKEIDGFILENQVVGQEDVIDLSIPYHSNVDLKTIESALRHSPSSASVSHLQRLAMHKRLGSSENDRTVLLHDYVAALKPYSEFTIYLACKSFWETDPSGFYPKVIVLVELCELIHMSLKNILAATSGCKQLTSTAKPKFDMNNYYKDPRDNPLRRQLCDFLISKGVDDYFDMATFYSNYQLESLARNRGWTSKSSDPATP